MRTVLLGTDFVYDKNGNLVPIETNTNLGFDTNKIEWEMSEIFDFTDLDSFISQNNINEVVYIGSLRTLDDHFESHFSGTSITYSFLEVSNKAVTVPFVEDGENKLIIRSAYDTTALVDTEYCENNLNFLKLIQTQSFGSELGYKDENGVVVNTFTTLNNNGEHPNYILKSIHAVYDKAIYPKLYKFDDLTQVSEFLTNIPDGFFLMPYHFNGDKLFQNHCIVLRSLNILYPPSLQSIKFGTYTKVTNLSLSDGVNNYNPITKELDVELKEKYITTASTHLEPKLEDDDLVQLSDGTFKTALDLQVGDVLKTIEIPNSYNVEMHRVNVNLQISMDEFISGVTYTTNSVIGKRRVSKISNIARITFTDGSTWSDTEYSYYLISENNEVKFKNIGAFKSGDVVLLIDTTNPEITITPKTVQTVQVERTIFNGWQISVETNHLFLTYTGDENNNSSYVAIEHNLYCGDAGCGQCAYCPKGCGIPQTPWNWCVNGYCDNCSISPCACY